MFITALNTAFGERLFALIIYWDLMVYLEAKAITTWYLNIISLFWSLATTKSELSVDVLNHL